MLTILLLTIHKGDLCYPHQRIVAAVALLCRLLGSICLMPPQRDRDRHNRTDNRVDNIHQLICQPIKF